MSASDAMEDARWRKDQERLIRAEIAQEVLDRAAYDIASMFERWTYDQEPVAPPENFRAFMAALRDEVAESLRGTKQYGLYFDGRDVEKRAKGEYEPDGR